MVGFGYRRAIGSCSRTFNSRDLRLSEIYYILSECLVAKEATKAEGVAYMNKVRAKRGALREISADNYTDELIWEGKKEYLAEGQAFFLF